MYKVIVESNSDGQRCDKFIKKLLPLAPDSFIYKMFRKKDVKINGKRVDERAFVHTGDELSLFLYPDKVKEFQGESVNYEHLAITFKVLYEDDQILVVHKPIGLILHEDDNEKVNTLSNQVISYLIEKGEYDPNKSQGFVPGPVHRLDRNTSGIVIFGKTFQALKDLNEMVRQRHCIEKSYQTIVVGYLKGDGILKGYMKKDDEKNKCFMVKENTPGALSMETHYHVIKNSPDYSLIEVKLVTGRTHQIRLHMSSIAHPVIGDRKYGDFKANQYFKNRYHLTNQLLHAYKITFVRTVGSLDYLKGKTIIDQPDQLFYQIQNDLF